MGYGFYHIQFEFAAEKYVDQAVNSSLLDIQGSMGFYTYWPQGFSLQEAAKTFGKRYTATILFLGLRKEYLLFLKEINEHIGKVFRKSDYQQVANTDNVGIASIRVMMESLQQLPSVIKLPKLDGGTIDQKVVFSGLPNQCFYCKHVGHFVQECFKRKEEKRW